ncbi:hypothetical protein [Sphingomonas sp. Leaf38]|uniref:hypothetical protein n=1 Tax=Sphingomonas sp. Leaf38 TaxID=1736217 RepID=UPI0012E206E1|nr:hypothetical protein [Sphingomonas sp. Leaf38]
MPRSDRDERASSVAIAGFCGLAVFGALVLIWAIGSLNGKQTEQRQSQPHRHAIAAKAGTDERCAKVNRADLFECVYDSVETAEETARAEQDLTAQQRAAWAGIIAAIIAFVSIPIGIFGLIALLRSLEQTDRSLSEARVANDISKKTAELELRAYISVSDVSVSHYMPDAFPTFTLIFKNSGQTIAHDVECFGAVKWRPHPESRIRFDYRFFVKFDLPPNEVQNWLFREKVPLGLIKAWDETNETWVAPHGIYTGVIRYRDIFGKRHWTIFKYRVARDYLDENGAGKLVLCRRSNRSN